MGPALEKSSTSNTLMLRIWGMVRKPKTYQFRLMPRPQKRLRINRSLRGLKRGPRKHMNAQSSTASFARKLLAGEFGAFFIYPMHDETVDAIWSDERNHQLLDDVLNDPTVPNKAKFLACEVFFKKDIL